MTPVRLLVVAAATAVTWGQQPAPAPALRLIEPTAETILTGPTKFRAAVTGAKVRLVVFQVDGEEACRAAVSPFECSWNAGSRVSPRVVRVVATLEDGSTLRSAVRTKGVTVADSSQVDSVLVSALVTDRSGRFVTGLTADDFVVKDEGVPQQVVMLDAGQDGAELVVALDLSGSMAPLVDELKVVVRGFLDALRPVDTVTLAGFNSGYFTLADRSSDRAARNRALDGLDPYGGTAIYDAIISGTKVVAARLGRRAVIVFTDGEDIASRASLESARAALHAEDAVLYLVATGKADSDPVLRRALTNLCVETGGAGYFASRLSGTVEHFREIVDELSKQYLLAFSPNPPGGDGKWRRLTVEPRNRDLRVRARSGYFSTKR